MTRLYRQFRLHFAGVESRYDSLYLACLDAIRTQRQLRLRSIFFGVYEEDHEGPLQEVEGRRLRYAHIAVAVRGWFEDLLARRMAGFSRIAEMPGDHPGSMADVFLQRSAAAEWLRFTDESEMDDLVVQSLALGDAPRPGQRVGWLRRIALFSHARNPRRLARRLRKINGARTFLTLAVRDSDPQLEIAVERRARLIGLIMFVSERSDLDAAEVEAAAAPLRALFYDAHLMRLRAREALRASDRIFRALVEMMPFAHVLHDGRKLLYANPRALELFGASSVDQLNQRSLLDYVHADYRSLAQARMTELLEGEEGASVPPREMRFLRLDGRGFEVETYGVRIDYFGRPAVELLVLDITERKRIEDEREKRRLYDALTGLPNQTLFLDRLEMELHRRRDGQIPGRIAVIQLDLDDFAEINERYSFSAGDLVMQQSAARITVQLGGGEQTARLAGDSFALYLEVADIQQALVFTQGLQDIFRLQPALVGADEIPLSFSAGISFYPEDGAEAQQLLFNSELALQSRPRAANALMVYRPELSAERSSTLEINRRMLQALSSRELEFHYQPQVDLNSGRVVGVEALLRWRRADGQIVGPTEFILAAEERGLIVDIGEWALQAACEQAVLWREQGLEIVVAVNIAPAQLEAPGFPELVEDTLKRSGLRSQDLCLEIVERGILSDHESVRQAMERLQRTGVRFHIDDFGVGKSALAYLRRFPVEAIKIDRSFTLEFDRQAQFIRALVAFAHNLDLNVIVEGVETEAQAAFFRALSCSCMQGYLFARPMPAEAIADFCREFPTRLRKSI